MDSLTTNDGIKKEIEDEVEIPVRWLQDVSNEEDSLADVKAEELEVKQDLVLFQDIKPDLSLKEEEELSLYDSKIEYEVDIGLQKMDSLTTFDGIKKEIEDEVEIPVRWLQDVSNEQDPLADVKAEEIGVIHELLPKIKIEAPPRAVTRELRLCLKRIHVADQVLRVVSPCEVRDTDNKKTKTQNIEEEETVAPKRLSGSSNRKNLKTSRINVKVPKGKQYNKESDFKCKECLYTCTQSGSLKQHMRTHGGERPFKCKECLYTCSHSGSLKLHMRTHTGERPFKCKECYILVPIQVVLNYTLEHIQEKDLLNVTSVYILVLNRVPLHNT